VVVQQAARDVPAVLVIEGSGGAHPAVGADADAGQLVLVGPSDEVPRRPAMCCGGVGEPSIEVALLAAAQRELVFGEPVQEGDGGVGALAHRVELLDGGGVAVVSLPQSTGQVPDCVAVQHLLLLGVCLRGQGLVDEPLDADHVFIASW
jgi:hypothetical protein